MTYCLCELYAIAIAVVRGVQCTNRKTKDSITRRYMRATLSHIECNLKAESDLKQKRSKQPIQMQFDI